MRLRITQFIACLLPSISAISSADQALVYSINAPHNDAHEQISYGWGHGNMDVYGRAITLGNAEGKQYLTGLRFEGVKIAKGTPILGAYIQFTAKKADSKGAPAYIDIAAENTANSGFFSVFWNDLSRRDRTNNRVIWQADDAWSNANERGAKQRTPDLTSLVQEVVNRNDWHTGNAMSFLLEGEGSHIVQSHEGSHQQLGVSDLAAQLVIMVPSRETFHITTKQDDAEERIRTGRVDLNSSDLELGWEKNNAKSQQRVALRFSDVSIPANAKVRSAYIQFAQDENKNHNPFDVTIHGEKSAQSAGFTTSTHNLTQRDSTEAGVRWHKSPNWFWLNEAGSSQRTPDLSAVIQEIIATQGWKAGNHMTFFIDGKGTRTAESFDGRPDLAPKLVVEFEGQNQQPIAAKLRLTWNNDPSRTMSIIWEQIRGTQPVVYYDEYQGQCSDDLNQYRYTQRPQRQNNHYGMNNVITRLTGLKPDTDYRFIIANSDGQSQCNWFRTAPATPKPFSFISGGDTKSSGNALQAGRWSNQMVSKVRPLFVFFTGDFNSGLGLNANSWQQWLNDWATHTRSEDGRVYPIVAVHGNHENGDFEVLYKLFDAGNPEADEPSHVTYNALSFGGNLLKLFSLNSELFVNLRLVEHTRQNAWFERNLKDSQDYTFRVVGYHKPMRPHSRKKFENDYLVRDWAPLMDQYDVHVAYESDTHNHVFTYPIRLAQQGDTDVDMGFVRDDANGILHVGEGSWGATPRDDDDKKSWTLDSGSFNQIKLNRVYPATSKHAARIDISPIKTAQYIDGKLVNFVEGVKERPHGQPMALPDGAIVHSSPVYGDKVSVPFVTIEGDVPAAPYGFNAQSVGRLAAVLHFQIDRDESISQIQLQRRDGNSNEWKALELDARAPFNQSLYEHTDIDLKHSSRYVYRVRAVNKFGAGEWSDELTIDTPTADANVVEVRQHANDYNSVLMVGINENDPYHSTVNTTLSADKDNDDVGNQESQVLLKFGDIKNQLPANSYASRAQLSVFTIDPSTNNIHVHRMLQPWKESHVHWYQFGNGVSVDDVQAAATPDATFKPLWPLATVTFDVTNTVNRWLTVEDNQGWVFINQGSDGWDVATRWYGMPSQRPILTIVWALRGDVDHNNRIDQYDVTVLNTYLNRQRNCQGCDINGDGKVNTNDINALKELL